MKKAMILLAAMVWATRAFAEGKPQTTCPVMKGVEVDRELFVDAEGYRIYVCCGSCHRAVRADPAKYVAEMQAAGVELEKAPEEAKAE